MKKTTLPGTKPVLMIVSHSHWDREWHLPFQKFRIKLGKMIDTLLNILATSPDFCCFMLDGQTIILEDYAELRPERVEELRAHIRAGRILIGPWYVLPDEFLVSGEAIIRNLLAGRDVASAFGGYMRVGYLPDQFGHIAQMPQILAGFGISSAVLWRGVDDETIEATEFVWRAPDGSGVLAINIPDGYFNAGGLPSDEEELTRRVGSLVDRLAPKANTQFLLLMNGGDHQWPQPDIPQIVSAIKKRLPNVEVKHSNLPAYVEAVQMKLAEQGVLPEVATGELRGCKRAHLLPGVLSTRMWIKQRNAACENLLEKWVEPFTGWAWIEATTAPKAIGNGAKHACQEKTDLPHGSNWRMPLQLAWKYLLQNQPHDSVCGCSIDQVHKEMTVRYDWVEQIGGTLLDEALEEISGRIDTTSLFATSSEGDGMVPAAESQRCLVVYNPLVGSRSDFVTFEGESADRDIVAIDGDGIGVPCQVMEKLENGKAKLGFVAASVPGIGYKAYRLMKSNSPVEDMRATTGTWVPANDGMTGEPEVMKPRIENEHYVVVANTTDGTIDILDRKTNQVYRGLNRFVDIGDAGDEYNLDRPIEDDRVIVPESAHEVAVVENGPARSTLLVRSVLRLPRGLSKDRASRAAETVDCPVTTTVSLYPTVRRIDFAARVENNAKDHRLSVQFPTGARTDHFFTETQFDVLRRDVPVADSHPDWVEDPVAARPQKSFLDVDDGERGLLLANRGLPECEVSPEPDGLTISLTLLRSVGWLSRGDLRSRRGDAGPEIPTPEAQCLGTHQFEYALVPHSGGRRDLPAEAYQLNSPLRAVAAYPHAGQLPAQGSFISVTPDWIPVSAIKPSHDGNGLVIRLYNPISEVVEAELRPYKPARRAEIVDCRESHLEEMSGSGSSIRYKLAPRAIATLKLYFW